jgi:tRNA1(Val) A37 N6-methylase TrmN6
MVATTHLRLGPGETLDRLAGSWWVYQLRDGQRYATDDVLVAWTAHRARPKARELLDLGSGVGSVGLMALLLAPAGSRLTTVEVQEVSVGLQRKTVELNRIADRVEIVQADLRLWAPTRQFELITSNPPYLAPGAALHSPHPQRAAARLELHGAIDDFCRTAARLLAPDGRFCFSYAAGDSRAEIAVEKAGLVILERREVLFRAGQAPVISLFATAHAGERLDAEPLTVRGADGERTAAFRAVRRDVLIEA